MGDNLGLGMVDHPLLQKACMVIVGMGQEDAPQLVLIFLQIGDVGDDHVHAQQIFVGEGHAGVNDDHILAVFQNSHVLADLVETAQRDDPQLLGCKGFGCLFLADGFFAGSLFLLFYIFLCIL